MKNYNTYHKFTESVSSFRKSFKPSLLLIFFAFIPSGCESFVDVDLPNSQLTASSVFEEKASANAAMTSIYAKMRDTGLFTGSTTGLSNLLGNYADELTFYANTQEGTAFFYNNAVIASNSAVKSLWNNSYNQIYSANAVIEGVEKSVSLQDNDRRQLKGEALFVRALIHFYLTNLFGAIPYVRSTDYQTNKTISKTNTTAIYQICIDDLKLAATLLPETYLTADRTRPNKSAARAVLARVYLCTQNWQQASNEASAVLNNQALYIFETSLSKIFLKNSSSTIWQFSANTAIGNSLEAQTFLFTSGPPPLSSLSETLINSFSSQDLRRKEWITAIIGTGGTWYCPSKYKNKGSGVSTEFSILIRLNEIYLIRAEARAHAGDLIGSKEDLNKIRNAAGLDNTTALSQQEILNAVLKERQLELFTEFGHRFFDLKRFNELDKTLKGLKPGWQEHEELLPLPESELILNKNINPQNTGY